MGMLCSEKRFGAGVVNAMSWYTYRSACPSSSTTWTLYKEDWEPENVCRLQRRGIV